ncbi:MAG: helix-turn-helix transcriptional regulator [Bacilli bacterium]|nr:helix-turn-helix transcriptional regulator [Bacilli bacterium]
MITEFGKKLRKMRFERNETLKSMALKLEVSSAFLSAVENGNKAIPYDLPIKVINKYHLVGKECDEIIWLSKVSSAHIRVMMTDLDTTRRNLAVKFSKEIANLDEEQVNEIYEILNKKRSI